MNRTILKLIAVISKYPKKMILSATVPAVLMINEGPRPADELVRLGIPLMEEVADSVAPKKQA